MTAMIGGADRAPARLAATRAGWHRVAEHMLAAALYRATGHDGLVRSPGGFRAPSLGTDARFRAMDGTELVVSGAAGTKRTPVITVRAAAEFGCPGRRHGGGGDQPRRAAVRHPWLRRADGARVRRPPRNGRRPDAVGSAACGRGVRPGHRVAGEPGRAAAGRSLPRAGPASRQQRPARGLIGNNGPVSTARASSFLNCAGGMVERGGR